MGTQGLEFWWVTGSQHLYGETALEVVRKDARVIVDGMGQTGDLPYPLIDKGVVTSREQIRHMLAAAEADPRCAGVVAWMHTFSPARMWISGLQVLQKPLLHFHTQRHRDIPWDSIDMEYMNLHQSAHGDREFGFMAARLHQKTKVLVGHWQDRALVADLSAWMRVAAALADSRTLRIARLGDNMRDVAVTEGDKVEAERRFGWVVNGYGVGALVERMGAVSDQDVARLLDQYQTLYPMVPEIRQDPKKWEAVAYQARIELGLRQLLTDTDSAAVTTTFEDLYGLKQLPGLAVQRLMADGYGFGAEGDWKTAGLLRVMKTMADAAGTSFMEDYTYHWEPGRERILGAHMLEICPSIAADRPRVEVWPLSIGGREDPARLVFNARAGDAVVASLVDLGSRFRLVVNTVTAVEPPPLPRLPVARAVWEPHPSLKESAAAWITAGGAHHTVLSYHVAPSMLQDFAQMTGVECVVIDRATDVRRIRQELAWNDIVYRWDS
jgi:L-arabinose isomerase